MDNFHPKCSIIIPVFNGERFIRETIESCLQQTLPVEVIIINDNSTDDSDKIIRSYSKDSLIYIKNKNNEGVIRSLNKASKYARSEYLLFLGHDDILKVNHVELMINAFDRNTSFVHCNADIIDKLGCIIGVGVDDAKQIHRTKYAKYYLFVTNIVHSTGAIIRKSCFEGVGRFDVKYKNYGEWLLWIKLCRLGSVGYCAQVKPMYRRHETNMTNSFINRGIKRDLRKYFLICRITALKSIAGFKII